MNVFDMRDETRKLEAGLTIKAEAHCHGLPNLDGPFVPWIETKTTNGYRVSFTVDEARIIADAIPPDGEKTP